ncbi:MAG: serine hydrolase [Brevundimonas sp.]|uniref:serine hydrolase domain-containing protein n=1 Tax=Brevundimonas sp. TaxID=1871086 RepID=UPI00248A8D62|nr:serine hydrolase domain-containing protein [Brevundimonas sp.]MDI1327342.1 serine hydrolase [Brevundimonas sp.]
MIATRRALLGGFAVLPLAGVLARDDRDGQADAALDAQFARHAPPAMAAAVVGRDGPIWSGVRGVRRAGADEPATLDQLWHLGSNGKAMTAVLYARLVEQGRAKWGATLSELFPGVAIDPALQAVTIDDLLGHRSGLADRDLITRGVMMAAHADTRSTRDQRVELAAMALGRTPTGTRGAFAYGNGNYILAGAAVERLVDAAWEATIQSEVFDPLGMASVGHGAPKGDNPWGHQSVGDQPAPVDPAGIADNPPPFGPAGRMHMTVTDYGKFLRLYLTEGGGLLRPGTMARLTTPHAGAPPAYAYGWGVQPGPQLGHDGSNTLWHVTARVLPARGVAVLSVANHHGRGQPANHAMVEALTTLYAPG